MIANPLLDVSVGPVFGMHPNLRNSYPKGYYFIEGKGSAVIKGLPFKLSFRQSDEDLRFGRASYLRLSFDAAAYNKQYLESLGHQLGKLDKDIAGKQKQLYDLEAKISYLYQKKKELDALKALGVADVKMPDLPQPELPVPDLPSPPDLMVLAEAGKLPDLPSTPAMPELPDLPELSSGGAPSVNGALADSLSMKLDALSSLAGDLQQQLGDLRIEQSGLKADYARAAGKLPADFMGGIKKLDFGLTTLGKSSLSRNAMPVQGIHVQYAGEHYFTDAAAGFTLPNQLFSNQAFDQLLYNSGNVFNMGDFFQVNSVRFVSSAKAGYGTEKGNHIALENYYAGATLHKSAGLPSPSPALTTNLTWRYSPSGWKNFSWQNTAGVTWGDASDSLSHAIKAQDRMALYSSANMLFPKLQSSLETSYRRIPSAYDGFTQGIYLRQTERVEAIYRQTLSKKLKTSLRLSRDFFYLQNTMKSARVIHQAGTDVQLRFSSHFSGTVNYSVLQLTERHVPVSPRSDVSHLGRLGLVSTHEIKKHELVTAHDISYARIHGFDSAQMLMQANTRYTYDLKKWRFGLQAQYSSFSGLTRLYGRNLMIQPEIGLRVEQLFLSAAYQQLWSQQFKRDYGMQFKAGFIFSEYVDCDLTMQRFLPTEYALFIDQGLEYQKPFYVKFALNVHLK